MTHEELNKLEDKTLATFGAALDKLSHIMRYGNTHDALGAIGYFIDLISVAVKSEELVV